MEIVKREWNRLSQVQTVYWIDIWLQVKEQPYACKALESFIMVLVYIL